jgi:hypothetical protein
MIFGKIPKDTLSTARFLPLQSFVTSYAMLKCMAESWKIHGRLGSAPFIIVTLFEKIPRHGLPFTVQNQLEAI